MSFLPLLAAVDLPQPTTTTKIPAFLYSDIGVICILSGLTMLALLCWVVFVRGAKQQIPARRIYKSSRSHSSSASAAAPTPPENDLAEEQESTHATRERRRKKRRTRRREHRGRNPTLAQTGGLPPPRNPDFPTSHIG